LDLQKFFTYHLLQEKLTLLMVKKFVVIFEIYRQIKIIDVLLMIKNLLVKYSSPNFIEGTGNLSIIIDDKNIVGNSSLVIINIFFRW